MPYKQLYGWEIVVNSSTNKSKSKVGNCLLVQLTSSVKTNNKIVLNIKLSSCLIVTQLSIASTG